MNTLAELDRARAPGDRPAGSDDRRDDLRRAYACLSDGRFADVPSLSRPWAAAGDVEHAMMLGLALAMTGEVDESSRLLALVAARRPDIIHPLEDLTRLLRDRDRERDALPHAEAAARLRPDDPRALIAASNHLSQHGRADEALALLRHAETIAPEAPNLRAQLGIALTELGRYEAALVEFRIEAARRPDSNIAWTNLACTLTTLGAFDEALSYYRRSITLRPDNPPVRLNHAISLLKAGRLAQGWSEYEWRLRLPGHTTLPIDRLLPSLDDATRFAGETVLVTHEEGLGDTLQFMRYLAPLRDRGARVVAWVPPVLEGVVRNLGGIDVLAGPVERLEFRWHCPFLSLPRAFAATADAIPAAPYVRIRPECVAALAPALPPDDGRLRVGLVWGGAPRPENIAAHMVDRRRSMGVAPLAHLARRDDLLLVSLQLGPYRTLIDDLPDGVALHDPMDASNGMEDTGALIAGLDIVVSVDTAIVHLAAGMGRPVLLLDRYDNCWRWLHDRDDSPFYPSLRILRQTTARDWDGPMRRAATILRRLGRDKRAGRALALQAVNTSDATDTPTAAPRPKPARMSLRK